MVVLVERVRITSSRTLVMAATQPGPCQSCPLSIGRRYAAYRQYAGLCVDLDLLATPLYNAAHHIGS